MIMSHGQLYAEQDRKEKNMSTETVNTYCECVNSSDVYGIIHAKICQIYLPTFLLNH